MRRRLRPQVCNQLRSERRGTVGALPWSLGHRPDARCALEARHIPGMERALDLRGCTLGPLFPPPGPPSLRGRPPPALTSQLSISSRPPPPGEGDSRVLGLLCPSQPQASFGPRVPRQCSWVSFSQSWGRAGAWSPAWFRLERREEGTGGQVAVPCSH